MNHTEKTVSGEAYPLPRCYVIQTAGRGEELLAEYLNRLFVPDVISEVFIPKREMNRRLGGAWRIVEEKLFPGYVFVRTDNPEELFLKLKKIPRLSRLLSDGEKHFIPLTPPEEQLIDRLGAARGDYTIKISRVAFEKFPYKPGDKVTYIDGDLAQFSGEITGFDLHKRKAVIQTKMFGGLKVHVGIDMIRAAEEDEKN